MTRRSNKGISRVYARFYFVKKRREREMSVIRISGGMNKKKCPRDSVGNVLKNHT